MIENVAGTRIGIYDILYECDYKTKCGHKMYHVRCSKCGWETDMMKSDAKKVLECKHIGINGSYINFSTSWHNQRISRIFKDMKERCYNENHKSYSRYGGRNIKICEEWLNNPVLFEEWALNNNYNDTLTIDRINGDEDYCPSNCRWVTLEDNAKYKSTTSLITVNNETHTGRDWAKILGFGTNIINGYVRRYGLDNTIKFIERYLNNPTLKPKSNQSYYDLYMTIQN